MCVSMCEHVSACEVYIVYMSGCVCIVYIIAGPLPPGQLVRFQQDHFSDNNHISANILEFGSMPSRPVGRLGSVAFKLFAAINLYSVNCGYVAPEGAITAHPDNSKIKVKILSPRFAWNNRHYTPLCRCLWQRQPPTATGPLQISWQQPWYV